ncbi:MAG: SsrA-binding protein SmpB [Elusimicrobia bacterium]|nr:SsrA-binding protein SmpB [Elusimicrobiota bacterium]MBD3411738.1 SsrA-binding protein SmpB [Elusimicrobiota bacterium]
MKKTGKKIVASNHRARRDYFIEEEYEAGMVLTGNEVKSIRNGKINLQDGLARIENQEIYLYNVHIAPYAFASNQDYEPKRTRKLLLHKREINRLYGITQRKGYTLVPLSIYFKKGRAKLNLGVGKGKKQFDKRDTIKKRELSRSLQRTFKGKSNV